MTTGRSDWTIRDKTCVITGPTAGIGRATALGVARVGAHLVLVCRDHERGEALAREIRENAGGGRCEVRIADLSSQRSIRAVARDILANLGPIHVPLNNADVYELSRKTTVDGIETVFAVNHLAGVTVNRLHPGAVSTRLGSQNGRVARVTGVAA